MKALIPISPDKLGGPYVTLSDDSFEVLSERERFVIAEFRDLPPEVEWFDEFENMYCQRQHDPQKIKVLRKATSEEIRKFRVPIWIQGEEIPECCGQPMFFVGQIDDDEICCKPPEGFK
jgi:hypothetical protein